MKYAKPDFTASAGSGRGPNAATTQQLPPPSLVVDDMNKIRNRQDPNIKFATDVDTSLRDFYWRYARGMEPYDTAQYTINVPASNPEPLSDAEKQMYANTNMYELTLSNKGGLVMPIIIEWKYKDGTSEIERIPAQVWRLNENKVVKTFIKNKEVASIKLDPYKETADINDSNNSWNVIPEPSKFTVFKGRAGGARGGAGQANNPMQKAAEKKKAF